MEEFVDRDLECVECSEQFTFTAGQQRYYAEHDLINQPKRCKPCREKRRAKFGGEAQKVESEATCSACGAQCTVPFVPTPNRPVFCTQCFRGGEVRR